MRMGSIPYGIAATIRTPEGTKLKRIWERFFADLVPKAGRRAEIYAVGGLLDQSRVFDADTGAVSVSISEPIGCDTWTISPAMRVGHSSSLAVI
jgi:hypothetical protein